MPNISSPSPSSPAAFLKETLKRAPFLVLAKTTPSTLPQYNTDCDFRYFFIADYMAAFSCLHGKFLRRSQARNRGGGKSASEASAASSASRNPGESTTASAACFAPGSSLTEVRQGIDAGATGSPVVPNAKSLFPSTYKHVFEEDAAVVSDYPYPSTLNVVERCVRPGVDTILCTSKTSTDISGRTYVLVACAIYDDVELGITKFKSGHLAAEMSDPSDVPLRWFEGAFVNFPLPMAIVDSYGKVYKLNDKIVRWEEWSGAVEGCMNKVRETRIVDRSKQCWEFSRVEVLLEEEEEKEKRSRYRVWVWRPVAERDLYAVCFRRHCSTTSAFTMAGDLPLVVEDALRAR